MKCNATETKLYCPICGSTHVIFRKTSKQKKFGHYKKFYCYKCKSTHNHIELKEDYVYSEEELNMIIEQMKFENKI